jgi:hypothetical protein
MHGELFRSRCDSCSGPPFADTRTYEPPAEIPCCQCGGRIRPHICWFGEVPFHMDRIFNELCRCTVFLAIGTSGVVEPAASFAAWASRHARTFYVGPEEPSNRDAFSQSFCGKAGEILPHLFEVTGRAALRPRIRWLTLGIAAVLVAVASARPQLLVEVLRNLAAITNILLFVFAFCALAWFFYWVILRRMLRARRIANARMKRLIRETSSDSSRHK